MRSGKPQTVFPSVFFIRTHLKRASIASDFNSPRGTSFYSISMHPELLPFRESDQENSQIGGQWQRSVDAAEVRRDENSKGAVERLLPGGVFQRHSRQIRTQNMHRKIAHVQVAGFEFIDETMTKYPRNEHTHKKTQSPLPHTNLPLIVSHNTPR